MDLLAIGPPTRDLPPTLCFYILFIMRRMGNGLNLGNKINIAMHLAFLLGTSSYGEYHCYMVA